MTEESALTGYLVQEVLDTQPPDVREVPLSTSILQHVKAGRGQDADAEDR